MSFGASGAIESLKLDGVEHAAASLSSGFAYRELPAAAPDRAPNGSFENGSGAPVSWTWSNNSSGFWSWDATVASAGSRSLRIDVPGTAPRRSPLLRSSSFPIAPNTPYTFSSRMRTSGLSTHLDVYVIEKDAVGHEVQRSVQSDSGTSDWEARSRTFTSSPTAVSASFKVEIYNGYGTAWLDDVRMLDVFGGRAPGAFGGALTADGDGLVQTATVDGLTLSARFTGADTAIRVDATLTDTTRRDRAVELSFRLPLDIPGWNWEQDPVTSLEIADGTRYENLDSSFGAQSHSLYPFAVVRDGAAAFTLATPMVPQMNRFSYDRQLGFRVTWDLGLSPAATKTASTAAVTFWIYTQEPRWGFRSAAEKYYWINAGSFASVAVQPGSWLADSANVDFEGVPNSSDFGWQFLEGIGSIQFGNSAGILSLHYLDASGWFRSFTSSPSQPPYDVLVSTLESDAASTSGSTVNGTPTSEMATAVINSAPHDENGRYQVFADSYFWYANRFQIYPVAPDPEIPAPSMWSVVTKYGVDNRIASTARNGDRLDGFFIDDASSTFAAVENYRRQLWAYSDFPLTFSYSTGQVTLYDGASMAEFYGSLHTYVSQRGLILMGSMNPGAYAWFAPYFDVLGGEANGADSVQRSYVRRFLGNGRPWSNLYVPPSGIADPGVPSVLAYLRQALFFGYFPGFSSVYWKVPSAYERDRPLFRQYIPLIRTIALAGWRPVPGAATSDPSIRVERFDDGRGETFYLTAQNSSTASSQFELTLDAATLGLEQGPVQVRELVRGKPLIASRSGSDIRLSDTLAAGETVVYRITAPRSEPPPRGRPRSVVRD